MAVISPPEQVSGVAPSETAGAAALSTVSSISIAEKTDVPPTLISGLAIQEKTDVPPTFITAIHDSLREWAAPPLKLLYREHAMVRVGGPLGWDWQEVLGVGAVVTQQGRPLGWDWTAVLPGRGMPSGGPRRWTWTFMEAEAISERVTEVTSHENTE